MRVQLTHSYFVHTNTQVPSSRIQAWFGSAWSWNRCEETRQAIHQLESIMVCPIVRFVSRVFSTHTDHHWAKLLLNRSLKGLADDCCKQTGQNKKQSSTLITWFDPIAHTHTYTYILVHTNHIQKGAWTDPAELSCQTDAPFQRHAHYLLTSADTSASTGKHAMRWSLLQISNILLRPCHQRSIVLKNINPR